MKKLPSKVAHNRSKNFLAHTANRPKNHYKSQFLFHRNCSRRDLYIMTLIAMCGCTFFIEERKLLKWGSIIVITQQLAQYIVQTRPTFHKPYNIAAKPSLAEVRHCDRIYKKLSMNFEVWEEMIRIFWVCFSYLKTIIDWGDTTGTMVYVTYLYTPSTLNIDLTQLK